MTSGRVTKLTLSYGAQWGRVRSDNACIEAGVKDLFFNVESLAHAEDFALLREGSNVEFDEEPDRANGAHAVRLIISAA